MFLNLLCTVRLSKLSSGAHRMCYICRSSEIWRHVTWQLIPIFMMNIMPLFFQGKVGKTLVFFSSVYNQKHIISVFSDRKGNILFVSSVQNQEDNVFVFKVRFGMCFLCFESRMSNTCLHNRMRNMLPLSVQCNQMHNACLTVQSGTHCICLQGRIGNILPLFSGIKSGICFLCLQSVIGGTLPSLEFSQEYTAFVFRIESGIYFLCLQDRIRNILPLSSRQNQEYTSSVFRVESVIYFLCSFSLFNVYL